VAISLCTKWINVGGNVVAAALLLLLLLLLLLYKVAFCMAQIHLKNLKTAELLWLTQE